MRILQKTVIEYVTFVVRNIDERGEKMGLCPRCRASAESQPLEKAFQGRTCDLCGAKY